MYEQFNLLAATYDSMLDTALLASCSTESSISTVSYLPWHARKYELTNQNFLLGNVKERFNLVLLSMFNKALLAM